MDPDDASRPARGTVHITPEADPALLPVPARARRWFRRDARLRWGAVFWTAVGGLVLLGLGLGITHLIEDLFARSEGLGYLGLAFASVAALALTVGHRARNLRAGAARRPSKTCIGVPPRCCVSDDRAGEPRVLSTIS